MIPHSGATIPAMRCRESGMSQGSPDGRPARAKPGTNEAPATLRQLPPIPAAPPRRSSGFPSNPQQPDPPNQNNSRDSKAKSDAPASFFRIASDQSAPPQDSYPRHARVFSDRQIAGSSVKFCNACAGFQDLFIWQERNGPEENGTAPPLPAASPAPSTGPGLRKRDFSPTCDPDVSQRK